MKTGAGRSGWAAWGWALWAAVVCGGSGAWGGEAGSVFGRVVDDRGQGVAGAWVTPLGVTQAEGLPTGPVQVRALTEGDGTFGLVGLPAGWYRLCVQAPETEVVNPCRWGDRGTVAAVLPGEVVRGVRVGVERGYRYPIRVEDPGGQMERHVGRTAGAGVQVQVSRPGRAGSPAVVVRRERTVWEEEVTVPYEVEVEIRVGSGFFQMAEEGGAAIAGKEKVYRVRVARGERARGLVVRVTGVRP